MPEMTVIINPHANRGDTKHQIDEALRVLADSGLEFEIALTEYRGHASVIAEEATKAGASMVVAAGGDGTVHECANGILRASENNGGVAETALAILPVGSGNDFAGGLKMDQGLADAAERLRRAKHKIIDVGYVESDAGIPRYFINVMGGGFDARVNIESQKIERLRGYSIYLAAILKTMAKYYDMPTVTLKIDGAYFQFPMLMTLIANGPRLGGGFLAAPDAEHDDGLFDICVVNETDRLEMLRVLPRFMKGKHLDHPNVMMARGKVIELTSSQGFPSQADGETIGTVVRHLKVSIIPNRLRVVV